MNHGNLMNYRTNEHIRPATREERFDSLHAMLDDDGRGLIETDDDGTCYVECRGVICVSDEYAHGEQFESPHDFVQCIAESWDLDLDLVLHDDGWHGPDGLLLVLA